MRTLANNLRYIPYLETLSLGTSYHHIINLGNNRIEKTGLEALALNLEFIPNLLKLSLCTIHYIINIYIRVKWHWEYWCPDASRKFEIYS